MNFNAFPVGVGVNMKAYHTHLMLGAGRKEAKAQTDNFKSSLILTACPNCRKGRWMDDIRESLTYLVTTWLERWFPLG